MLDLISRYREIIKDFNVLLYDQEGERYRIKIELIFKDDSKLFIKEYLFENNERKYAYHWSDISGILICRWDNASHWRNIGTFPHHKHIKNNEVIASVETTLEDILQKISNLMKAGYVDP